MQGTLNRAAKTIVVFATIRQLEAIQEISMDTTKKLEDKQQYLYINSSVFITKQAEYGENFVIIYPVAKGLSVSIGIIFVLNLIDYLTTEENVKLGGSKSPQNLLSEVNIPQEAWIRNVLQLTGGQQQRVAIARALASDTKVLLADEPTGNLDENSADEIIKLLWNTAHKLGKCVIVVTHSKKIADIADEVIQIKDGFIQRNSEINCLSLNLLY